MKKYVLSCLIVFINIALLAGYALADRAKFAYVLGVTPWQIEVECPQKTYEIQEDNTLKFCLNKTDHKKRCEISIKNLKPLPETNYIRFDYRLSEDIYSDRHYFIMMQIHGYPDEGEVWRCPPYSFDVLRQKLNVYNRWDETPITKIVKKNTCARPENSIQSRKLIDGQQQLKNVWHSLSMDLNISHTNEGLISLKLDDGKEKVFKGPNTYNDQRIPYTKIGIYKPNPWSDNQNRICAEYKNINFQTQ